MQSEEQAELKAAIMQSLSAEVDKWLATQGTLATGYAYEAEFMKVAQRVNKVLLEKSLGAQPASRNHKKKFTPASGK